MSVDTELCHRLQGAPNFEGAPNFRDLGGYTTRDGSRVRRGRLFRSQSLAHLTDTDVELLHALGVQLVCDLRSDGERRRSPNRLHPQFGGERLEIGIDADLRANGNPFLAAIAADPTPAAARRVMLSIYGDLPQAFATIWPSLIDGLLERQRFPAVIHCTAGKDRTGFACALLLLALDVPRDEVYRDYLRTRELFPAEPAARDLHAAFAGRSEQALPLEAMLPFATVETDYLDAALTAIERDHGGVDRYLSDVAGLDAARRGRLRELLVEG